ncbi:prohibitin family protein [Thermus oshimai]|jgi:regulator of protease activity HflC (stomatin/prohibitin superfamily)|uniref:Membrane protease subunit, stomatin/prohibitin n=1 Tax=Thermus oshimai JL-2 TaxID=751945 RepID=K7QXU5_THEOS|nr:prohibitin family protein [Thermus oshimai]AFV76703.1 membrane protease subunit, stomatin/prohibitin [Thermus oshimai JL-2]
MVNLLALALLGLGVALALRPERRTLALPLVVLGGVALLLANSLVLVPAGHVGVVFNVFRGVQPRPLGEGVHLVLPLVQQVILYDARVKEVTLSAPHEGERRVDTSIRARSKEGLEIGVDVTVQYRVLAAEAARLHQEVGPGYLETLLIPQIRSKVRDAVGQFGAAELISTQRTALETAVIAGLEATLQAYHIELVSVLLREIRIPEAVAKVIEEKQTAEQQVQIEINRRKQAEIAAERRIIEARAERDAAVLRAEGEARAIELRGRALKAAPEVVQLTFAEKLAPGVQTVFVPSTGNFLLDLRGLGAQGR